MPKPPTQKDLENELHDVKTKWKAIGVQLEVANSTLKSIDYANKGDCHQAFSDLIDHWLSQESAPSWAAVIEALSSRSVGETALAKGLEDKYCPGGSICDDGASIKESPVLTRDATLLYLHALPYKTSYCEQLKIIERTASSYSQLGIFLLNDDDGSHVKRIEMSEHYRAEAVMREIFSQWVTKVEDHSWKRLIECLKTISYNTLARDIELALEQNGVFI